jgi:integrase
MSTLNELITFEYQNEHVLEHDLLMTKNFSSPKIYNANGDLSKRWYVYFSFRNPETGKLERMKNIYGKSNIYKTKEDRLTALAIYRRKLLMILKEGFNPYQDNIASYTNRKVKQVSSPEKIENAVPIVEQPKMTLKEAFDFGLKLKEKLINSTTKKNYENRIKNFLKWLEEQHPEVKNIDQLSKKSINSFLNDVLSRTSSRTRNNARVDLSSILQELEDNDIIALNFIKKIKVLKSIPERNKTYTTEKQEEIFNYLEDEDPLLLLYIKFISYNFLRPIEVCRLNVGDLNLTNRTVQFKAKNSPLKTKLIPELLINDLPDLSNLNKKLVLFTPDGIGREWETDINNRRDYFTKRFKTVVKDHFNLGADYGLYSFRHTYITKLYRELIKNSSPTEAEGKLMLITGHATITALRKYLRDIDAELPADYSEMLK